MKPLVGIVMGSSSDCETVQHAASMLVGLGVPSPDEYIAITEVTSSQVTAQIGEFVTSKPPEEWQDSYISYMEALKKFNSYIVETKVAANMLKEGQIDNEIMQKIEALKSESQELINKSDELRPSQAQNRIIIFLKVGNR